MDIANKAELQLSDRLRWETGRRWDGEQKSLKLGLLLSHQAAGGQVLCIINWARTQQCPNCYKNSQKYTKTQVAAHYFIIFLNILNLPQGKVCFLQHLKKFNLNTTKELPCRSTCMIVNIVPGLDINIYKFFLKFCCKARGKITRKQHCVWPLQYIW